jgi:transcriptional regulator with XRE-family HTH domain
MLNFQELQLRLKTLLHQRIRSGQLTERGVARRTGISQPHIHNVLKGKREFSFESADAVLRGLGLDVLDLLDSEHVMEWQARH